MDPSSMAQMLTSADRAPLEGLLRTQHNQLSAEKEAYSQIKNKLQALQDAIKGLNENGGLSSQSATFSSEGYATATVKAGAANADYQLYVKQLAKADQYSLALDESWTVPTQGTLDITVDGQTLSLDLSTLDSASGLTGLRDAINKAADNNGVQASLVRSGGQTHLMLTGSKTGASQAMTINLSGGNGEAGFTQLQTAITNKTQLASAQDAVIELGGAGGLQLASSTNNFDGQIDGLNLTVSKAHAQDEFGNYTDAPLSLSVSTDQTAIEESLKGIVDAYNSLVGEVQKHTQSKEGSKAVLAGDSMARGLLGRLRGTLSNPPAGVSLAELGIKTDRYGKLSLDTAAMARLQQNKPGALEQAFTGENGLLTRLEADVKPYLDRNGTLVQRDRSLQSGLDRITDRQEALDNRMNKVYQRYLGQFTRMQTLAQQMQQTMTMF
ncbi:flagellar filament capping protein FliD [Oceanimonas smirnovii]|uniref:flagellar filament capping protein FliD n=1 Tax=Oceanimonas smirnovii TaxID=264574 RepID=UPI00037F58DF|nr:flagellar filament capping protein FliD [Oceanimonas smirnovii]